MAEGVHIGDTINFDSDVDNCFALTFLPLDFFDNWERGSLLSNFAADYFRHNFPTEREHNLISTVLNELIENAVKFSKNKSTPVEITMKKRKTSLLVKACNSLPRHQRDRFVRICEELFERDLDSLYVKRIESDVDDPHASGIGLILVKKDYCSGVSFDFSDDSSRKPTVAVTVRLDFSKKAGTTDEH